MLWLLSDARNDPILRAALEALPRGSGFVFRHYHLDDQARALRFGALAAVAKASGHLVIAAAEAGTAQRWGADGIYGDATRIAAAPNMWKLATAHDGGELAAAMKAGADGIFLSPVFATRSHPNAKLLGIHGFHVLAQQSSLPVIALGGMNSRRAAELGWPRWGAIDAFISPQVA